MSIRKEQFIWDFYKNGKGKISSFIQSVSYKEFEIINKDANSESLSSRVLYLSLFPGYLSPKFLKSEDYTLKKAVHHGFSGVGISLESTNSVECYLKENNKKKIWVNLKRAKKRLEANHLIDYEYNYGHISDEKCAFLMKNLRDMLSKRFGNGALKHSFIMDWENNILDIASSIRNKKTSLIVIYANNKPVSISVNRHVAETIFFCDTHAFDLNYQKYGLGNLNNSMRLNLCYKNKIPFLDLGNGVSEFKKNWSNCFYETYYLIFYKKDDFIGALLTAFEILKITLKNLIKLYVYDFYKKKKLRTNSKPNV
ncbi:hypothetical protein [uncultured Algibacter sp.]|uniref:hypothetical protein n=1 Tax=uncultured Algibacter sp. TaxID=298659 RepID=UPI00262FA478|nr:hypothetical protein [uncultured Algibacter sp.]